MCLLLSARKAPKHTDPLQNLRHVTETEGGVFVPMYCKDKVYCGIEEFSFEELRALRWKAKKRAAENRERRKEEERRKAEEKLMAGKMCGVGKSPKNARIGMVYSLEIHVHKVYRHSYMICITPVWIM